MTEWILQANPEKFKIDKLLIDYKWEQDVTWIVDRHRLDFANSQVAYIFNRKSNSIVASGHIIHYHWRESNGAVVDMSPLENEYKYWTEASKQDEMLTGKRPRVRLCINRIAPDEGIAYSRLRFSNTPIGLQGQTNYKIERTMEKETIRRFSAYFCDVGGQCHYIVDDKKDRGRRCKNRSRSGIYCSVHARKK